MRFLCAMLLTGVVLAVAVGYRAKDEPGKLPALPDGPVWYKGNLHTHTLWSDGDDFPEMVADWYKRQGYAFLGLTDHNRLAEGTRWVAVTKGSRPEALRKYRARYGSNWVETRRSKAGEEARLKPLDEFRSLLEVPGKFLLVPAEEITGGWKKRPVHMNAINLRDAIKPARGDSVAETMRVNLRQSAAQQKKTGRRMLTVLNHPNFGWGVTAADMMEAPDLRFFEVYNGHPTVHNEGDATRPGTDRIWDEVLAHRLGKMKLPPVFALATDDAHNYHQIAVGRANPGRGWIMAQASHLTAEAIVGAMEAGRFYATSGVLLDDVVTGDGKLRVKIHPMPGVKFRTQFFASLKDGEVGKVVAESDSLEPSYSLTGQELYVRARVTSTRRHPNPSVKGEFERAWTQPLVPSPR